MSCLHSVLSTVQKKPAIVVHHVILLCTSPMAKRLMHPVQARTSGAVCRASGLMFAINAFKNCQTSDAPCAPQTRILRRAFSHPLPNAQASDAPCSAARHRSGATFVLDRHCHLFCGTFWRLPRIFMVTSLVIVSSSNWRHPPRK